jgi:hypothetical protein
VTPPQPAFTARCERCAMEVTQLESAIGSDERERLIRGILASDSGIYGCEVCQACGRFGTFSGLAGAMSPPLGGVRSFLAQAWRTRGVP